MRSTELKMKNRPPHLQTEPGYYFITCRTIEAKWFLQATRFKQILLDKIHEKCAKFDIPLIAYVILHNHYHLILQFQDPKLISKFMRELNGASSRALNDADGGVIRKVWWNYYDHFIRDEADFFKHLNYIHQNPIKHGLCKELSYPYSSYDAWVKKKGSEYVDDSFRKHPIVDFKMLNDES